jgi:hypothetical protein
VPLYFCGAKMLAMYGTAPVFDSMGLINPVYSYGDTIAISFTADRDMLPDPDNYAQALRDSFEDLKKAAATQPAARPANENKPRAAAKPRAAKPKPTAKPAARRTPRAKGAK